MSTTVRDVKAQYAGPSVLAAQEGQSKVSLALDSSRGPVGLRGTVTAPALFRDALMAAFDVLGSDFRYKRKDLAVYLAYLTKQGKKANKEIWEAQKAFLEQQLGQDEKPRQVLEPVLTVSPDEVSLEVFSADESSYARLSLPSALFAQREAAHGSTTLLVDEAFIARLERMRSWQPVSLEATNQVAPGSGSATIRQVPLAWLRNFVQVQSAATLPATVAELAPIDLYNLLFVLRTQAAKKPPRGVRFELVPGAQPRIVIEPFDIVLECHGAPFTGKTPRVVRIFGRQRLLSLTRALPHVQSAKVHLLGAGLPVFWALDFGESRGSLTVGFTGWTDSGWSSASAFDALMPPPSAELLAQKAFSTLQQRGPSTFEEMVKALDAPAKDVRAALQLESLKGRSVYDLVRGQFRPRQLLDSPIDVADIRFSSEREKLAHRLLSGQVEPVETHVSAVRLTKVHDLGSEGTEISGEVEDKEARRTFMPSFTLDPEGRVRGASCTCLHFKRSGVREGPCEHLLALRLFHQRRQQHDEALRQTAEGRALIRAETRTFVRRETGQELVYRVSLDDKVVRVLWGPRNDEPRQQRTWFDTDSAARDAYFARLEALTNDGFIDAG